MGFLSVFFKGINLNDLINPKFEMHKQCLLMGFMWNIKQHTTNHKYAKLHYVLLDLEITH
jgi:hypothetical protein